jgi:hypothetical protein
MVEVVFGVLAAAVPVLIGVGVALAMGDMDAKERFAAKGCFWVAAVALGVGGTWWLLMVTTSPIVWRFAMGLAGGAVVFVGLPVGLRWIDTRARRSAARKSAFSQTQSIKVLPPFMGGNDYLLLDNVARLRRHVPYSMSTVTLILDVVPQKFPDQFSRDLSVADVQIYEHGTSPQYRFDLKNNRHEVPAHGRVFVVTLFEIRKLEVPGVSNPIEYVFGISESV